MCVGGCTPACAGPRCPSALPSPTSPGKHFTSQSLSFPVCKLRKWTAPAAQAFVRTERARVWHVGCPWHVLPGRDSNDLRVTS